MKNTEKNIYIDKNSIIEDGVVIFPNVYICGNCEIKKGTKIYPNSVLINSKIGENCEIKCSYIEDSEICDNVKIGPFAHIRPNSKIENNAKIGNFVEIKSSYIGKGTKVSHLAYIGDSEIGQDCNVGCGVIFANFDGKKKYKTTVGNNCFIGSNSNIIAPVIVSDDTYICAGTTITENTNKGDFVIGRNRAMSKSKLAYKYLKEN